MPGSIDTLRFRQLSFQYSNQDKILENCDFEFPMGKIVSIGGRNGSGRSTILKLLATMSEPMSGEYWINDNLVNDMSFEELIPFRLSMGYGFDYGGLLNNKSLRENLMLPLQYHNVLPQSDINTLVDSLLQRFGLATVAHHRPAMVSGSQRKVTCVIRSFVLNPELLVLDNPTHGLSADAKDTFFEEIESRKAVGQLKHVFLVSDDPRIQSELVEDRIFIEDLKLVHGSARVNVGTGNRVRSA